MANDKGFEAWLELFSKNIELNFKHARYHRGRIETDHKEFLVDGFKPLKEQVDQIEECVRRIGVHLEAEAEAKKVKAKVKEKAEKEASEIKVARITSQWEFWGIVAIQIGVLIVALLT